MPPSIISRVWSPQHRLACLSLYKALLKQSSALSSPKNGDDKFRKLDNVLQGLIRFRFRHDRKLHSPTQIANGLKAGYEALDLVYACANQSAPALAHLTSLIESTASRSEYTSAYRTALAAARSPTSPRKHAKIETIRRHATKANSKRYSGSKPVLERPLPLSEIKSGRRRVPNLVSAQGIPFLRYSKPQPVSLSRVLRQKQSWTLQKWEQKKELEYDLVIANWEDQWDDIIERQISEETSQEEESEESTLFEPQDFDSREEDWGDRMSWNYAVRMAEEEITQKIMAKDQLNAAMGAKMWEIVLKERELAAQEKIATRDQRRIERKAASVHDEIGQTEPGFLGK